MKIRDEEWMQAEAAQVLGITQSRVSDLIRGKFHLSITSPSLYMIRYA